MEASDLVAYAAKLLAKATCDDDYRVVIDRAYYGAYHAATAFEDSLAFKSAVIVDKAGVHEALIQRLERPHANLEYAFGIDSRDIGAQMRMLKPFRELATYELKIPIRVDRAEDALGAAKDLLATCKKAAARGRIKRVGT